MIKDSKLYTLPCPLDKQQFIPVKPSQYSQSIPMYVLCDGQVLCAFLLIVNAGTLLINTSGKKSLWRGSPGPPEASPFIFFISQQSHANFGLSLPLLQVEALLLFNYSTCLLIMPCPCAFLLFSQCYLACNPWSAKIYFFLL